MRHPTSTKVGMIVIIVLLACTAAMADAIDLTATASDEITAVLQEKFEALDGVKHRGWRGPYRHGYPDPHAFEFLLELDIEHVPADPATGLPEFYKLTGTLFPEIRFELRLPPRSAWNRKFFMAGCGGFCGGLDTTFANGQFTNNLNWGLLRGYASATTDSGHDNMGLGRTYGDWARDNRRGEIDWGYRSIHEVTRVCKALVLVFYHRPARYAYYAGCSTGGRMGVMEAIRYPEDFDGIISGAPALEYTALTGTWMNWIVQASDGVTFSAADQAAIEQAVLDQCDGIDGQVDGLIADPRRCRIDLSGVVTAEQQAALDKFYGKPVNSLGKELYPGGIPYGSEIYWPLWVPGTEATSNSSLALNLIEPFNANFLLNMAFDEDPPEGWDPLTFDFDAHPQLMSVPASIYNAVDSDLSKFKKLGGKLIMYHGWADPIVPPARTIAYYESVVAKMGGLTKAQKFFRLFMVPGMDHCSQHRDLALLGVPLKSIGLDDFDVLGALENWVENGTAPEMIVASGQSLEGEERTRPLYPYPLYAQYMGGDPNSPGSYMPQNDGSVRWRQFRKDTFYAFEIPELGIRPLAQGEHLNYFQPYDHGLDPGIYAWRVWSPSMFDDVDYPGYFGDLEVE